VDPSLNWQKQRFEQRFPPLENPFQICTHRLDQQDYD
jgi:hypothetical protein